MRGCSVASMRRCSVASFALLGACTFDHGAAPPRIEDAAAVAASDAPRLVDDAATQTTPDGPPSTACPSSYTAPATGRYRIVLAPNSWLAAEQDCEDDLSATTFHTHLVVVDDAVEAYAVASSDVPWAGVTDLP